MSMTIMTNYKTVELIEDFSNLARTTFVPKGKRGLVTLTACGYCDVLFEDDKDIKSNDVNGKTVTKIPYHLLKVVAV